MLCSAREQAGVAKRHGIHRHRRLTRARTTVRVDKFKPAVIVRQSGEPASKVRVRSVLADTPR